MYLLCLELQGDPTIEGSDDSVDEFLRDLSDSDSDEDPTPRRNTGLQGDLTTIEGRDLEVDVDEILRDLSDSDSDEDPTPRRNTGFNPMKFSRGPFSKKFTGGDVDSHAKSTENRVVSFPMQKRLRS